MKPVAFTTHPGRLRYRELFRCAGPPFTGVIACGLKFFRLLRPQKDGFGLRSFGDQLGRVEIDALPRRILSATDTYRAKLKAIGFLPSFAYSVESYGSQEAHGIAHRHKTGVAAAAVAYARVVRGDNETLTVVFGFNTPLADGRYVMTSGYKRQLNKPSHFLVDYMPEASPKEVFERHLDRLEQVGGVPRTVKTDDDLERLVLNVENEDVEFNFDRGVYVRMSQEEIELGEDLQDEYQEENGGRARKRRRRREDDDDDEEEEEDEDDYDDERNDEDEDDDYDDDDSR